MSILFLFDYKYFFVQSDGLFILPDTDSDPDPDTDIRPKNGYSSDWGSGSGLESKSESVQWEQCLYSTM